MRRVVVTGLGIVSSIGNTAEEVLASLKAGRSGITANEQMKEHGFRSQIAGAIDLDVSQHIDKRTLRFMGPGAGLCPYRHGPGDRGCGAGGSGYREPAHRPRGGQRRALDQRHADGA